MSAPCVKPVIGRDIELGNFVVNRPRSGPQAARLLLEQMPGVPAGGASGEEWRRGDHARDQGRRFDDRNGCSYYIDLGHLEVATAECLAARDLCAVWRGALRLVRSAQEAVAREGTDLEVFVANSDGVVSWGGHLSVMISEELFHGITRRRGRELGLVASFLASGIVFAGSGGLRRADARAPGIPYRLSQRAPFIETLRGEQTTTRRPIVNTRDEALAWSAGLAPRPRRLHVIAWDSPLCDVTALLQAGCLQLLLTMMHAVPEWFAGAGLILDDPVEALHAWSDDHTLRTSWATMEGQPHQVTAVEHQLRFLHLARRWVESGSAAEWVPDAELIVGWWTRVLSRLLAGDLDDLVGVLDWVTRLDRLRRTAREHPRLEVSSPFMRYQDFAYGRLGEGGFFDMLEANRMHEVVSEARVAQLMTSPPEDTRAWGRSALLRLFGRAVGRVDWDALTIRTRGRGSPRRELRIDLPDPLGSTRAELEPVIGAAENAGDVLRALDAVEESRSRPHLLPASTRTHTHWRST